MNARDARDIGKGGPTAGLRHASEDGAPDAGNQVNC